MRADTIEPLTPDQLTELQAIQFGILIDIDAFCKQHGISYFMAEGSLLGTVRHHGPIPWDDDIDICMMRDQYERFLALAPGSLDPARYQVQHASTVFPYWSPIMKVRLITEPKRFGQAHIARITRHNGPCVDIFPLEYVRRPGGPLLRAQSLTIRLFRGILTEKLGVGTFDRWDRTIARWLGRFFTVARLHHLLETITRAQGDAERPWVAALSSYHPLPHQLAPASDFAAAVTLPYSGLPVPVPAGYDDVLARIYGHYMTLPAEAERTPSHHYAAYTGRVIRRQTCSPDPDRRSTGTGAALA